MTAVTFEYSLDFPYTIHISEPVEKFYLYFAENTNLVRVRYGETC